MIPDEKFENLHGIVALDVECPIHELDQLGAGFDQIQQVAFRTLHIKIPDAHFYRRKTKLAAERTTAASFKINDPVGKTRHVLRKTMRRRYIIQRQLRTRRVDDDTAILAVSGAEHAVKGAVPPQLRQQMVERFFPFAHDNEVNLRKTVHPIVRVVRHLRSAEHHNQVGHNFFEHADDDDGFFDIPYIAGESDHIRLSLIQIRYDVHRGVLDRVFGNLDVGKILLTICLQIPESQRGMNIFGIKCG